MKVANSLRELASAVGRSHQVVARWVKRSSWNQGPKPPWDIDKAIAWAAKLPDDNAVHLRVMAPTDRDELARAKLRLAVARAEKLEIERAVLAGDYISRKEVEEAFVRRVHAVRAAFESLPRQLARTLVGLDEIEIERRLDAGIRDVLAAMSGRPELPAARA